MLILILFVAIILICLFRIINECCTNIETFHTMRPKDPMRPRTHVKLNDFGGVDYVSDIPPCGRGDRSCAPIVCPAVFKDDLVCWKCLNVISEPQNFK